MSLANLRSRPAPEALHIRIPQDPVNILIIEIDDELWSIIARFLNLNYSLQNKINYFIGKEFHETSDNFDYICDLKRHNLTCFQGN